MNNQQHTNVKIVTADPSAIGLFGLAIVTFVASSQKLGLTEGLGLVIPWAIFLGAFAQLYASILDAKHNNTFGTTAFGAYAFFWFATASSWLVKLGVFGETLAAYAEMGIALLSFYGAGAAVLNNHFGKVFLPVGRPFGIFKERS
ncbi:putative membrane protein [Brevibacillus sp. IT-7CA2]|uniref:acetate uptake transporter n=1 Tax=Brevibacillus sp. IT-7CA2 TaxID=3026436 RepID=UPI0039DF64D2